MPKVKEPESFEKQEYEEKPQDLLFRILKSSFANTVREQPNIGVTLALSGDTMTITFQSYEMNIRDKMDELRKTADKVIRQVVSAMKKDAKKSKIDFLPKEKKDQTDYTVEKVSLNDRYLYRCWKRFTLF